MSLKYEPASEPLHISVKKLAGIGTWRRAMQSGINLLFEKRHQFTFFRSLICTGARRNPAFYGINKDIGKDGLLLD